MRLLDMIRRKPRGFEHDRKRVAHAKRLANYMLWNTGVPRVILRPGDRLTIRDYDGRVVTDGIYDGTEVGF